MPTRKGPTYWVANWWSLIKAPGVGVCVAGAKYTMVATPSVSRMSKERGSKSSPIDWQIRSFPLMSTTTLVLLSPVALWGLVSIPEWFSASGLVAFRWFPVVGVFHSPIEVKPPSMTTQWPLM
jgi:hypothetical protein